jgi:hypothetical protein
MKINKIGHAFIIILVLILLTVNISSATTVEVITEKLPTSLQEGKQVDFTIQIKNYENVKHLTLETSLVKSSEDKPLWNFGDSESVIDVNRYQQKVTLNLTSLPAILNVKVSGKVPSGVEKITCGDIVLDSIHETKLKFYEIGADDKLIGIESFDRIIVEKENFVNTLQQIRRKEFDGLKTDVTKVFDDGLTADAQKMASEINNIKWPNSLLLFGMIPIESDMTINVLVIGVILVCLVLGYILGSRGADED